MLKNIIQKKLKKYNQEHLLNFYDNLEYEKRQNLLNDIKKIDFGFINNLYKNSFFDEKLNMDKVEPLNCVINVDKEDQGKYKNIGIKCIKNNEYSIVIMAGGNASRLGLGLPKGCLEIKVNNEKITLFEIYINQLKKIKEKYNIYINVYIMTSSTNYKQTKDFFMKNNYFNYPKDKINFFIQNELPILDVNGKILLKDKSHILFGPNGNGDVFLSMKNNGILKQMKKNGNKYVLFSTVDNVLSNLIDEIFIGATIANNYQVSSKTITKTDENDNGWIFCKYDKHPYMLPSMYITPNITNKKDNSGNYIYREKNITYHLLSLDLINKITNMNLQYHRAYKKNDYMDLDGNFIKAETPNSFKFEQFIFDSFNYAEDMLLYRITEDEFCPIKNIEDIKKAENILSKY